jgi:hypothetical protein
MLKLQLGETDIEGLVDTGAEVTIVSQDSWNSACPLQRVSLQLLGNGTLSQEKQSIKRINYIGQEGQNWKINDIYD